MSGRHRLVLALCVALGSITLAAMWLSAPPRAKQQPIVDSEKVHIDPKTGEKYRIVGGVRRSVRSLAKQDSTSASHSPVERKEDPYGRAPVVPRDANPMVKSVSEALSTGKYPERLSALISPKPFDLKAYQADPTSYLNVVEPGRVFQSAEPGENVPVIKPNSQTFLEAKQGETVSLKVKAISGAPVTFTSFDMGAFQNQLPSITVAAGDDGVAIARFTGTPGTYNLVHILAASPEASGRVNFTVNVKLASAVR